MPFSIEYSLEILILLSLHKIHSLDFPKDLHTAYDNRYHLKLI